jgi:hypothetical protein
MIRNQGRKVGRGTGPLPDGCETDGVPGHHCHVLSPSLGQPKVFAQTIMSAYFKQTKYKSFQRQLNLHDFHRETRDGIHGVCK